MIDHADDLATVFYGPDTAAAFTRVRLSADDVTVMVILGTVDDEALDARAIVPVRVARFMAGQDVRADDKLVALEACGPDVPIGTTFKLLDMPKRVNDGLEMEALLGSVAT